MQAPIPRSTGVRAARSERRFAFDMSKLCKMADGPSIRHSGLGTEKRATRRPTISTVSRALLRHPRNAGDSRPVLTSKRAEPVPRAQRQTLGGAFEAAGAGLVRKIGRRRADSPSVGARSRGPGACACAVAKRCSSARGSVAAQAAQTPHRPAAQERVDGDMGARSKRQHIAFFDLTLTLFYKRKPQNSNE